MRASVYREKDTFVLRPQFSEDDMRYLRRGMTGQGERERLAFFGNMTEGLWLWLKNDAGYRLRPIVNGKGKPPSGGGYESRIPCVQISGPTKTIVTQEIIAERRWWKHNIPALYIPPQFPFNGMEYGKEQEQPFNPIFSREPLHWQAPSGKDDKIKIVPPDLPATPQPADAERSAAKDVARDPVEDTTGGATAAVEPEGSKGTLAEPPPPTNPPGVMGEKTLIVGREELDGMRVVAEAIERNGQITVASPGIDAKLAELTGRDRVLAVKEASKQPIPTAFTVVDTAKALREAIELVNSCMDDCGDDIVLKIDGNRVKASRLVVQEVDL